jgi:hypothetical protein
MLIIKGNIAVAEVKCWVTESDLYLFSVCMTCSLFTKGDKSFGNIKMYLWALSNRE